MAADAQPFYASGPIPTAKSDTYLHGYEEERRTLVQLLNRRSPFRLGILGGPESGKTSLVLAVAPLIPEQRTHLDCGRLNPATPEAFYTRLLEATGTTGPIPAAPPHDAYGQLAVPRKGTRGVLVLENVHELADIDRRLLDEIPIYSVRLPYHLVLTGERDVVAPHVETAIELHNFSEATANDFLRQRFASVGMNVGEDAYPLFREFSRGSPATLQRLGLAVWERARNQGTRFVTAPLVDAAVAEVVDRLPTRTIEPFAALRGFTRDAFIAMCLHDLRSPTDIARRVGLEPKNAIVLLSRLEHAHRLIERVERGAYRVRDPMLQQYVRKEWGAPILR